MRITGRAQKFSAIEGGVRVLSDDGQLGHEREATAVAVLAKAGLAPPGRPRSSPAWR
jgi:hypothetical protein